MPMSNITLYKLADELREVLDKVDPETGELPQEFGQIRELVSTKAAAVAAYISSKELEAESVERRLKEISEQVKRQRKRAEALRGYLLECMSKASITEIDSNDNLLRIRRYPSRDESVEIDPQSAENIPDEFLRIKKEPDKLAIKKALKDGAELPFARIVKKDRLSIG